MENTINKVEEYVTHQLTNELSSNLLYHNLAHTQRVVSAVKELIEKESLDEENKELLILINLIGGQSIEYYR